jgi:serine/threonine protein kinase/tetratricopeptide (TPR) repeat protein
MLPVAARDGGADHRMTSTPGPAPRRLADFEVLRRLGTGGMAEVFLAKRRGAEGTFKMLVLKRILPAHDSSRRFRTMFAEEAQLATRLNHPNIVQVYDFQDYGDEGQLLSMEYVEGPDLRRLQRACRDLGYRLPPLVSAFILAECAKGLHYAHERKDEGGQALDIVHRDVSPQNILLSYDGGVKIADFGIATANVFRDEPGVLKGKTAYMSPEQARAEKVDRRTDIYSLGVVLYELLAGRPVHGTLEGPELLEAVRAGTVEPPSLYADDIPPELEAIVMRALSRDREDRFHTARDMATALTRVLLQKQELVDAHVLSEVIAEVVPREDPAGAGEDPLHEGSASAGSSLREDETGGTGAAIDSEETGPGEPARRLRERRGREVRHVAVVNLRLHAIDDLVEALGPAQAMRTLEQLRSVLDEVAFKRGARWSWDQSEGEGEGDDRPPSRARAVVGLLANPAHAPADAAMLAVDVHDTLSGASDDLSVTLSASVGIVRAIAAGRRDQSGHLVDFTLQRPAHFLAALLGDRAPPAQTWVAGGLYRLVRREFVWGDAPTVRIDDATERGLPENMRMYSLVRPLTRDERAEQIALAPRDLVGRDAEVADLHAAYHRAVTPRDAHTRGQTTGRVIVGEMGIGKSALTNAFLAELPPGARVVRIECSPVGTELPYYAVGHLVRALTGTRVDQPLEEARSTVAEAMGDFAGGRSRDEMISRLAQIATGRMAEASDEADVQHNRRLVSSGIRRFFARAAMEAPLVVVVDGAQWCDRVSLDVFSSTIRRGDPLPTLVLVLMRPDDKSDPYLEGIVRLELRGLRAENQLRLVQTHVGARDGVAQVCADLIPRAAGNPYFLLEMVDALLERGVLEVKEGADGAAPRLVRVDRGGEDEVLMPSTLEQLIADRLNELPLEEHAVVLWLAVSGGPMTINDLSALAGPDAEDSVVRLCARGLCDDKGDLVDVRHPLTRDVAYRAIEDHNRARMHRLIGERLVKSSGAKGLGAAIVARHFALGGEPSEAAGHYLTAAQAARASYQLALATRYFGKALELLDSGDVRAVHSYDALENIARVQGRWRDRREYLTSLRKVARTSSRPFWVATALVRSARYDLDTGHLARGLSVAQKGEQVARQCDFPRLEVEAQSLMAEMLRDLGDMQGALAACDRALETAARASVPFLLRAEVLRARGTLLLRVGRVQEAVRAHAEAIAVFRKAGARRQEARARNSLAFAMFVLGRFEDGIALGLEAIRIDLSIGGRFQIAKTLASIGHSYARVGDMSRAQAYFKRARDAHQRYGDQDGRADTLLGNAEVLLEAGDVDAADELVGDAGALNAVTGSAYDSVHEKILRALVARMQGDSGSAVMHAFDARQVAEAQAYVAFHFYAMAIEAAARVEIGEHHTGILLATTAIGAIETIQGSEYGLETRALCVEALETAASPQAPEMRERAARHVRQLLELVRDPELRTSFLERPLVASLLGETQALSQDGAS